MSLALLFAAHLISQEPLSAARVEAMEKCVLASSNGAGCGVIDDRVRVFEVCVSQAPVEAATMEAAAGYFERWEGCEATVGCLDFLWPDMKADPLAERHCLATHLAVLKTLAARWRSRLDAVSTPEEQEMFDQLAKALIAAVDREDQSMEEDVRAEVMAWSGLAQIFGGTLAMTKAAP